MLNFRENPRQINADIPHTSVGYAFVIGLCFFYAEGLSEDLDFF